MHSCPFFAIMLGSASVCVSAAEPPGGVWALDETPAAPGEWGFRPADGSTVEVTPPGFVWRPQKNAVRYHLQVARDERFADVAYEAADLDLYCHCPPRPLESGKWYWRFRATDQEGKPSAWSEPRSFIVDPDTAELPLPSRTELRHRVPKGHPRLFLRPEDLSRLRNRIRSDLAGPYGDLVKRCEKLLTNPPPTAEPKKYPQDMERKSEEWRELWWGNRVYTIRVLESAATLAFVHQLDGNKEYGQLARRLLMDAAKWDPQGATGFRYNDEAGMPYAYHFSRTYTLLYDALGNEERDICRKVMTVRGREMYDHLRPMHIWRPYNSHANRAWHFLGEVGIAFLDEIPEAEDWMWFAMNVFYNAYPVWCDADGGWHEGLAYWRSYIGRFTWWADVMRSAFGIDAYRQPYFSQIGYYPMYLQPPGTVGGGFGDLCGRLESAGNVPLVQTFAAPTRNPHWQWYVEAHGGGRAEEGYIGFLRGALPVVEARPPTDLPSSRCFHGIGQAMLNTNLLDAGQNVELLFKSSPFGTQSHGYDANNAFILYAFGKPLFISSGWRDIYGSDHHVKWMWHTKSTNSITVDGDGQIAHSVAGAGRITHFVTQDGFDYVCGEAGPAYGDKLNRFTRRVLFVKPDLILIHDLLEAPEPARFEWWLHAPVEMRLAEDQRVNVTDGEASCDVEFLEPRDLTISQTDRFDPPPRPRVQITEYHLTASTTSAARECEFVTVLRPHRKGDGLPTECRLAAIDGGWALEAGLREGKALVLLRRQAGPELRHGPLHTRGDLVVARLRESGEVAPSLEIDAEPTR